MNILDMNTFLVDAIDHIEIYVEDQEKTAKWYDKVFSFKIISELEFWSRHDDGPLFIGNLENNIKIALFQGNKDNDGSIRRIAFRVSGKDFLFFLDRLSTVPVFSLGKRIERHNVIDHEISFSVYFNDPDGNQLEITSYDYNFLHTKLQK